jgi:hypothetical protein
MHLPHVGMPVVNCVVSIEKPWKGCCSLLKSCSCLAVTLALDFLELEGVKKNGSLLSLLQFLLSVVSGTLELELEVPSEQYYLSK